MYEENNFGGVFIVSNLYATSHAEFWAGSVAKPGSGIGTSIIEYTPGCTINKGGIKRTVEIGTDFTACISR